MTPKRLQHAEWQLASQSQQFTWFCWVASLYMEERTVAVVELRSYCGEWPGVEKEGENSDKAAKSGVMYQKLFVEEDASDNYLVETPRTKPKMIKELPDIQKWPWGKEGRKLGGENDHWAKLKLTVVWKTDGSCAGDNMQLSGKITLGWDLQTWWVSVVAHRCVQGAWSGKES